MTTTGLSQNSDDSKVVTSDLNPIAKKVAKILDSKIETDKEIIDSLDTISTFFKENTLQNRRNLRRDIEKFSLQVNWEFLESFKKVKDELDKVTESISAINACCKNMSDRLQTTKLQTQDLIAQTTKLQSASKQVQRRTEIVTSFLSIFQLQPLEIKALRAASDGLVTKEFFDALNRTKEIHADCKQLLLNGQHTAGLEIMDSMANYQENAYEMLYRWIQKQCDILGSDKGEVDSLICQSFAALESRPVLFKYSLDEYCNARRNFVVRSFLNALTKGGPSGVPKPIELLSHDPLRYVNDMLAWIHQCLAGEKEFFMCLLKDCTGEDVASSISTGLTHITEGLGRPFKIRVEQVMSGENGPVVLYKLSNMFKFYYNTVKSDLDDTAPLLEIINDLSDMHIALFRTALMTSLNRLLEKFDPPGQDLMPVQGVHQVLLLLKEVLEAHDVVVFAALDKKESFSKIFDIVIDSLLSTLILTSTELNPIDLSIYVLNCLGMIASVLALYQYTEPRLEMLQAQIDVHLGVLISEQAGYILQRSGISSIYNAFNVHKPNQGPCNSCPGLDASSVKNSLEKFEIFTASPDSYKLPQCQLLSSPKFKLAVDHGTYSAVAEAYKLIYNRVLDPANQYANPTELIRRTPEDIDSLLSQ